MFVAYIMTKQNELVLKLIRARGADKKVFTRAGFEYNIQPDRIYFKRFLFIKYFRFSIYIQDKPEPLKFDMRTGKLDVGDQDIPMDEIAYIIKQLKKDNLTKIAEIGAIIGAICAGLALYYSYKNFEMNELIFESLKVIYRVVGSS